MPSTASPTATRSPIDAVITWVDGNDPVHRRKLDGTLEKLGLSRPSSAHNTRFNDAGEIDYCITSILRFAPWFRRIHIVCDAQVPAIVERLRASGHADRFNIVDHREIFRGYEQHLPTFNSRSIISMLWRIEDLADDFVYFNDDMMLLRDVSPDDFFRDGKVVERGQWRMQDEATLAGRLRTWFRPFRSGRVERVGNLDSQQLSARVAGFEKRYFRLHHNPYPMRRTTLAEFFKRRPDLMYFNSRHRFRSNEQFKAESVDAHLQLLNEQAIIDNRLHVVQIKPSEQLASRVRGKLSKADGDPGAAFVCVQSIDLAPPDLQREIFDWLDRRVGPLP
ncbi:MAG: Stealth CR1 domain-containing protein [Dokdonella sp.]